MKKLLVTTVLLMSAWGAAHAGVLNFYTTLTPEGADGRMGSGSAVGQFDDATNILSYTATFTGLSSGTTVAHFHCCSPAPFSGNGIVAVDAPTLAVPVGVTSGTFFESLDLDEAGNFNADFITASGGTVALAIARFVQNIQENKVYLNIHSQNFRAGEIRGYLRVPEPGSAALAGLGLGLLGLTGLARRRQRAA